jgi:peptidoglycan/LPS O-acetylase OafA/YrhL
MALELKKEQDEVVPRPAKAEFHIPSLDGIRAFSWLIVLLSHSAPVLRIPGRFGVTIFFFLSGYLITTLLRMEIERTGTISLGGFYSRRFLRIFPPLYVMLAAAFVLHWTGVTSHGGNLSGGAISSLLLQYSNYFVIARENWDVLPAGTTVCWSLAVEEHFYFVFPALYLWMRRNLRSTGQVGAMILGICLLVLAWRAILALGWVTAPEMRLGFATDTRVDSILFGCLLAVWGNPVLDGSKSRFSERTWKWILFPLGVLGMVALIKPRDSELFRHTLNLSLQGLFLMPIFVTAIRWPDWGPMRVLNLRPVKFLGVVSYSLYLFHSLIVFVLEGQGLQTGFWMTVLSFGLSVLVAWLVYRLVEVPAARWRKKLRRLSVGAGPEAVPR